jgi:hypothetical protein
VSEERVLSIDIDSEIESLSEAQLKGSWQIPAELVRLAFRIGAYEVRVNRCRRRLVLRWPGPVVAEAVLENLGLALDSRHDVSVRQRAIGALETAGVDGLLWAAGAKGARIRVGCSTGAWRWRFENGPRGRPRMTQEKGSPDGAGVELEWACTGLDVERALRWLAAAVRFAPAAVLIDGRPAPRGFAGGLFHLRLEQPVPCRLGLTRGGDSPVLWLLKDGVVSSRAGIPDYPPFEAAVELGGVVASGASDADLRRAVGPFLSEIVDRAVWMMVEVAQRMEELTDDDQDRLTLLLLRAARRGVRADEIRRLPLLRAAAGDAHRLSINDTVGLAERRDRVLSAIDPGDPKGEALVDPQSTLAMTSEVRGLVARLTGIRFQTPPRRLRGIFARGAVWMRGFGSRLARRVRGMKAPRTLIAEELRVGEASVLAALQTGVRGTDIAICEGTGRVGKTSRTLVVPRACPTLLVGADLAAEDRAWIYPLLLALDTGEEPTAACRERWLRFAGFRHDLL